MNKIPCAFQNTEAKSLPAEFCVFSHFGRLSPAAVHSADSRFDSRVNGGSLFHWMSNINAKTLFYSVVTLANNTLNRRRVVVFDRLWANAAIEYSFLIDKCRWKMVNTLPSDISNYSAISRNFNSLFAKTSWWIFFVFSGTTAEFGRPEHSASFVSVRLPLKSAPPLTVVSNRAESE